MHVKHPEHLFLQHIRDLDNPAFQSQLMIKTGHSIATLLNSFQVPKDAGV